MKERIDQRRIPGLSRLFADYLYDPGRVSRFFPGAPYDAERLRQAAGAIDFPPDRRRAMADQLGRQNQAWGAGPATAALIDRFAQPGGVAVLTGQQVGFLGGPLLGLHKAMTAVKLAGRLRERGVNAVPIFWMASQDHDLAEVDHAWALDGDSNPVRISAPLEENGGLASPAGGVRLAPAPGGRNAAEPNPVLDPFARASGIAVDRLADLDACYRPGVTLADAFARLLSRWFADSGLIVFDPLTASMAAEQARPFYLAALERQSALASSLARRNQDLESMGYHVQVSQAEGATMLFLHRDGERMPLRQTEPDAAKRGSPAYLAGSHFMESAEVKRWIEQQPLAMSPSALLRPLIQDALFPTLASVTGPAETAYMAQSAALYGELGLRQPAVYPRASVTLIDAKAQRLLEKFSLRLDEIWNEPVEELLARRSLPAGVAQRMRALRASFDGEFAALAGELQTLDPTLMDAARTAAQKIEHQLEQLDTRIGRSVSRRSEELQRHARFLAGHLYPGGSLQERVLCVAASGGPGLVETLHRDIELDCPDHQRIDI